ncbi:MAG: twin transmembrane helix small protein [Acetobacteraceae bacterium]|nr:twin transmembrane helix small protein [Acetobacteraceae bacterium]
MKTVMIVLVAAAMLATVGVLIAGLLGLARNPDNGARSNRLMRYRIGFQFLALVLFGLLMLLTRG